MQHARNLIVTLLVAGLVSAPTLAEETGGKHARHDRADAHAEAATWAARNGRLDLRAGMRGERHPRHAQPMRVAHKGHGKHWKHKHHGGHKGLPPGHRRHYDGSVRGYHYVRTSGMIRLYDPHHHLYTSIPLDHGATWEIIDGSIYVYGRHRVRVYGGPHFHLIRTYDHHHHDHHEDSSVFFGIRF